MSIPLKTGVLVAVVVLGKFLIFCLENAGHPDLTSSPDEVFEVETRRDSSLESEVLISASDLAIEPAFVPPISRAAERVTKKPFGIHITKMGSPVQPERFSGYHTGVDFEIFSEEADSDVAVSTVCPGELLVKRSVSGYGGIAVQSCIADGKPITVVYGHLRLSSIAATVGETLKAGDFLGTLGTGNSAETDGERKHLHLGVHKGTSTNILGYVRSKGQLSEWIDPYLRIISGK
jgi:murein DD-endopeptidase MepM/ murein hydrolase activator NlpD